MLKRNGYGKSVDFYSLGVFLYEMIVGGPPGYCEDKDIMYNNKLSGNIEFPQFLSDNVKDLIQNLLKNEPEKRLGSSKGFEEIKEHMWLKDVNWDDIFNKRNFPGITPNLNQSNFDNEYTSQVINFSIFSEQTIPSEFSFTLLNNFSLNEQSKSFTDDEYEYSLPLSELTKRKKSNKNNPLIGPNVNMVKISPKITTTNFIKESKMKALIREKLGLAEDIN